MENKISGVTFILIRKSNKILMQLRDENAQHYPNQWCFPGGTMETNESPIQTVLREIKEEFNIKVTVEDCHELMIHNLPYGTSALVFVCQIKDDQFPTLHEGKEICWMDIDEIKKINLGFEQNKVVLPVLEKFLNNTNHD